MQEAKPKPKSSDAKAQKSLNVKEETKKSFLHIMESANNNTLFPVKSTICAASVQSAKSFQPEVADELSLPSLRSISVETPSEKDDRNSVPSPQNIDSRSLKHKEPQSIRVKRKSPFCCCS